MKTLVIGELNVDIILDQFSNFPSIGKEVIADKLNITLGSSSAIFASNLSNLGNEVSMLGIVGDDYFGEFILTALRKHKVNTDYVQKSCDLSTGLTVILNANEDRANVTHPGAMYALSGEDIDYTIFSEYHHLHISSYFLQPGLQPYIPDIFRKAKKSGLTTSFDMQWDPSEKWRIELKNILPFVDVYLPNEKELLNSTKTQSVDQALEQINPFSKTTVVKQGARGSLLHHNRQCHAFPAFLNKEICDAIGAGDSFNAGFIHQYVRNKPLKECQDFGSLTGAISTTRSGGTKALESKFERHKIAKEKFNRIMW